MRLRPEQRQEAAWLEELIGLGLAAIVADEAAGMRPGQDDWLVAYAAFARQRRGRLFLPRPLSEAAAHEGYRALELPRFGQGGGAAADLRRP